MLSFCVKDEKGKQILILPGIRKKVWFNQLLKTQGVPSDTKSYIHKYYYL